MDYITTSEAAERWQISPNRVTILARNGRIPGAVQTGARWMIPTDAEKPTDARTKNPKNTDTEDKGSSAPYTKKADTTDTGDTAQNGTEAHGNNAFAFEPSSVTDYSGEYVFRFPSFEGRTGESFFPPLTREEKIIKKASEAFHACRFKDARKYLSDLEEGDNIHYTIYKLYSTCMINFILGKAEHFFEAYGKLAALMMQSFPRKKELSVLIQEVNASIGIVGYFINDFEVEPRYSYDKSYLPHLASLEIVSLFYKGTNEMTSANLRACELNCKLVEASGAYVDLETMHLYLGIIYSMIADKTNMNYHLKKGFDLAEKYQLYWVPSVMYCYYRNIFEPVLVGFDSSFAGHIRSLSKDIHFRYHNFSNNSAISTIFNLLKRNEYLYVFYAINGLTNREIADKMGVSEKYVSSKYRVIYEKLGVGNKVGMLKYYEKTMNDFIY